MEVYNFLRFNSIFFALSLIVIGVPFTEDVPLGIKQTILVVFYHLFFVVYAYYFKLKKWLDLYTFLLPLSIFLFFPDWVFSSIFKVLVYIDEDNVFKIFRIPAYIAGMWTIPLFMIIVGADLNFQRFKNRWIKNIILLVSSFLALNYFEEATWELPVWYYQNVHMVSHVAAYVLLPNTLIGLYAFHTYKIIRNRPFFHKIVAAFVVMLIQLASLLICYFVIEKI